jgi:ubiquitin carboxyl-terminal hydrolase L5
VKLYAILHDTQDTVSLTKLTMPPKSAKRKTLAKANARTISNGNGDNALTLPDRNTWPGWVEMESEPAFFNVMLKDMGVDGVKMSEVWSLEDNDLAVVPQPVHALIFLFRYRETNKDDLEAECPEHVWYAEQVPDFSCATVALLNILNNIPGLEMGKDLRKFKEVTQDMTPRERGEAIDQFTSVKRIHNSFAREGDMLQADMLWAEKAARARKRQAVAKAQKTRAENAARKANNADSPGETPKTTHTSGSARNATTKFEDKESLKATPSSVCSTKPSTLPSGDTEDARADENGTSPKKITSLSGTPRKTSGSSPPVNGAKRKSLFVDTPEAKNLNGEADGEAGESAGDSTPNKPSPTSNKKLKLNAPKTKPKSDQKTDQTTVLEEEDTNTQPRRSRRAPQPRKDIQPAPLSEESEEDEEGFHYCAYLPISGRVWKLDGLDKFPQDMGLIEEGQSWLSIAQPILQNRMAQYAAGAIEFNIMAVVHDPILACVEALASNIKVLRAVEARLTDLTEDWREMIDEENESHVLIGQDLSLGLHNVDIERAEITRRDAQALFEAEDLTQMLALREEIILQQCGLRFTCSDEMDGVKSDAKKAATRRHDYTAFAREWLGALAEQEVLEPLMEAEE